MKLTSIQQKIVEIENHTKRNRISVLSSAGSGKSTTLIERVLHLLKNGVPQTDIKIFSFSKTAANEIVKRLEGFNLLQISTLHSFCYHVIIDHPDIFRYRNMKIISNNEMFSALKRIVSNFYSDTDFDNRKINELSQIIQNKITKLKKSNESVDFTSYEKEIIYSLNVWMQGKGLLTFDDLIYNVYNTFKKQPEFAALYKFKYVFLDENQDSNKISIDLISLLIDDNTKVMCFQDIQQTLYRFNYADPFHLMNFFNDNNFGVIRLDETFRFGPTISKIADMVVDKMKIDDKYKIKTKTEQISEDVSLHQNLDRESYIISTLKESGIPLHNHNILCRTNKALMNFEKELKRNNIPYYNQSGSFLERSEIKFIMTLVGLFTSFTVDDFTYISKKLKIGIDDVLVNRIYSKGEVNSVVDFLNIALNGKIEGIGKTTSKKLIEFNERIKKINDLIIKNGDDIFTKIANEINIDMVDFMKDEINDDGLNNRDERWDFIRYLDEVKNGPNIHDFFNDLKTQFNFNDKKEITNAVILRTVHSSKGMTLPIVYLCLDEFCNPNFMKDDDSYLDELFCLYVGVTRTKNKLNLFLEEPQNHFFGFLYGIEDATPKNKELTKENFNKPEFIYNASRCPILLSGIEKIAVETEKAVGFKMRGIDKQIWIPKKSLGYKDGNLYTQSWVLNSKF